jgi:DNA repair protein RecN (Recombination protein N)
VYVLVSLSIRNMVLIDRLELQFAPGLTVLTGETGAGKSILLDALSLAGGARADSAVIRKDCEQATVSAAFSPSAGHPVFMLLQEQGIDAADGILLRRVIGRDGRSRAFINDQQVSIGLLKQAGSLLIEVHGQNDDQGLLNLAAHRTLLDAFAGLGPDVMACREAHRAMAQAAADAAQAEAGLEKALEEEAYLRHVLEELEALSPHADEEQELARIRALSMNSEKLTGEIQAGLEELYGRGDGGAEGLLNTALRRLERVADKADSRLDPVISALAAASSEIMEARVRLEQVLAGMEFDPRRLEEVESRLFSLRAVARKYRVQVEELPGFRERVAGQLALLDAGSNRLEDMRKRHAESRAVYDAIAARLSGARIAAAQKLDRAVKKELAPLKLEKASFRTIVRPLNEGERGVEGADRVEFHVATNPGASAGPLSGIASGGELSRFMLALRVALARTAPERALVFDEVDSAVGGAVADAVGERLARLSQGTQVLVVTHSPQVAARGDVHWRVEKSASGKAQTVTTSVRELDAQSRREEIARMLAGAEVTDAARAAADSLMAAGARS